MSIDDSYRRILDGIPTMSADDQAVVAARYARTRDPRDAERLVLGNLRLVVKIARELGGPQRRDLMDLVQEGNAGLTHAVHLFDAKHGAKLSTYAAWWIRAYIMRHMMDTSRIVRMSSTREGRRRFFDHTLPDPDRSLEAPTRPERDSDRGTRAPLGDLLADEDDRRPDVRCELDEYRSRVREAITAFSPTLERRARGIFEMRLLREEPARLSDVGRRFGISGERARQLETRVRGQLRDFITAALGETAPAAA
jgi:RNA polymerase sigma-32 factor